MDVPDSTLRARLRGLEDAGILVSGRASLPRRAVSYELTDAGVALTAVADMLKQWLARAPGGDRPLAGAGARAAISALCEGWSAALLRPLAAKPLSVADLDQLLPRLSYPAIERRIAAMRDVGQVEPLPARGRETPYAVTEWLRRGAAPLLAAIRWEHRNLGRAQAPAPGRIEFETLLLLVLPLLRLDGDLSGACRLLVELPREGDGERLAGVIVDIRACTVTSWGARLDGADAGAWAAGSPGAWLRALLDGDCSSLELGGDGRLASAVVTGLHCDSFRSREAPKALPSETLPLRR